MNASLQTTTSASSGMPGSSSAPAATARHRVMMVTSFLGVAALAGCAAGTSSAPMEPPTPFHERAEAAAPSPDPRVGLEAGVFDAEEAVWNLRVLSRTAPPEEFVGVTNSDLAFKGDYAIQGNYDGILIWDVSTPSAPTLVTQYVCPASQSDVSVYGDLLFVSGEGFGGRLDCGTQGVEEAVSDVRLRGIRIFDISDIRNPEYIANVQTCRGSHTHSVLVDPDDDENVYVYVSGSAPVRPAEELPGCVAAPPDEDPNSALFRIEVIRVPLDNPEDAAIATSPRIFADLVAPPEHGLAPAELAEIEEARAQGKFVAVAGSQFQILTDETADRLLAQVVEARGGTGAPTAQDSTILRDVVIPQLVGETPGEEEDGEPEPGPTQCHDITLYPALDIAGGACEGYGFLLDISDPVNPVRLDAVADSNFAYWHSSTFNNDGSKVLFTDEWGGGGQPKCRASDPREWGANAIFTVEDQEMTFQSYYKLPAPQTEAENCVAHNGSLIPVPGRDIMVQSWYQGGISIFDWTDPVNPVEIAFHDRGPVDPDQMRMGGSWSVYWYNGLIVSSEIARGLDIFELEPNPLLTQNEIDAANTVTFDYLNAQGQPHIEWPASFALARAFVDQLERSNGLSPNRIASVRDGLDGAEAASGGDRASTLESLADEVDDEASGSLDPEKVERLSETLRDLAAG